MLSTSKQQLITSLSQKKFRDELGLFVAEGVKIVNDLIFGGLDCEYLFLTKDLYEKNNWRAKEIFEISERELNKISSQKTPQGAVGVFKKPDYDFSFQELNKKLSLALDEVQNPGNLGTIVRIADWFGIEQIFCSQNSADQFAPKTVQATMGALVRVKIFRVDIFDFLLEARNYATLYGTFLHGSNIYKSTLSPTGIIVLGNEGNGISRNIKNLIDEKLFIPSFQISSETQPESLNVAVAAAIVCSEFRRRK